jgi:hypothetical protein
VPGRVPSLLLVLLLACHGEPQERASEAAVGPVVATVNGAPVALSEVEVLVRDQGLTPREALTRLIDNRLLAQEAIARGYGELPSVRREAVRASVQALLAQTVERDTSAQAVETRRERLSRLLVSLSSQVKVTFDEPAIKRAFAEPPP